MKLNDDFDDLKRGKSYTMAAVVSIAAIVLIVICVLMANADSLRKKSSAVSISKSSVSASEESDFSVSVLPTEKLTVSDLDFYDLYPKEDDTESSDDVENTSTDSENKDTDAEEKILDESEDGRHTKVTLLDGTIEWVSISPYIPKNSYDLTNLLKSGDKFKYFEDDKCISTFGVDICDDQDYVDFNKLKKAGCDFVMLRVGTRGYQSGQVCLDEYFAQNLKRATDAGLEVGLYFFSQAITSDEAIEEANYLIASLGEYKINYPVAFVMKNAGKDATRIDALSKKNRTDVAVSFMNTVKNAGLKPMLYGDKLWLIKYYDLSRLYSDYDFWYSEIGSEFPDYPYKFTMWEYEDKGTIDGISGEVKFTMCFTDYKLK